MTPRRKILLAATALIVLALGWYFWPNTEPKYDGRSVSYWYKIYCRSSRQAFDLVRAEEAFDALRHLGTNALPYLIDQAYSTNKDSASRSNFIVFINSLPGWLNAPVMATADEMHISAKPVIYQLKPPAGPLMALVEQHTHSTNFITNSLALSLFGAVGSGEEQVLPYLTPALKGNNLIALSQSLQSLQRLGPAARPAVPELVEFLAATKATNFLASRPVQARGRTITMPLTFMDMLLQPAAGTLGNIGPPAAPAVPLLNEFFQTSTNPVTRGELAFALCRIDATQTNALNFLADSLKYHTNAWGNAAKQLGEIGPGALSAVPVLMDALNDGNEQVQTDAAIALKKIGVPTEQFIPRLKTDLKSQDFFVRFRAAMRVIQVEPGDRDAHLVLLEQANENSPHRYGVVTALGAAGPAAKDVAPALRALLKSKDDMLRSEAAAALKKIEAPEAKK